MHFDPTTPCAICRRSIGTDEDNILAFESLEVSVADFEVFRNGVAHVHCLSAWPRRDEFIEVWNDALGEHFTGKELYLDDAGRVNYTDSNNWLMNDSPAAQRRREEAQRAFQAQREARRQKLERSLDAARQKAISFGLAGSADVDQMIYNMSAEEFRKHFGEFQVSRAFFRSDK